MSASVTTRKLKHSGKNEGNLYGLLGIEEEVDALSYTDVPAFEQKKKDAFRSVIVHVRNREDLEKLAAFLEQPAILQDAKGRWDKSVWYPALQRGERGQNSLIAWMDENDPEVRKLLEEAE